MVAGLPLTERNLIITGYIEPNKPRIGRQVATTLDMPFVDVEEEIKARLGDSLDVIRSSYGQRHIQTIEAEVMAETMLRRRAVVRINGSTLAQSEHFERLRLTGPIICLVARLDAILQRMHLSLGARYHDPADRAVALGELQREWAVRKLPGIYEIDATYYDEQTIVEQVITLWQQVSIERA